MDKALSMWPNIAVILGHMDKALSMWPNIAVTIRPHGQSWSLGNITSLRPQTKLVLIVVILLP